MRGFRDAKVMARALRDGLMTRGIEITHSDSLELTALAFGFESWNILSAKIEAAAAPESVTDSPQPDKPRGETKDPKVPHCGFCGKNQHEVRKLIAGPKVFICDQCVAFCTDILEPEDDIGDFRGYSDPALTELARAASAEELAHYVERCRRGAERNRNALLGIQRRLDEGNTAQRDLDDKQRQDLVALQEKMQRVLERYEGALQAATTALSQRRQ